MGIGIDVNSSEMVKITNALEHIEGGIEKALRRATSRVSKQGKTHISRAIRSEIAIKASVVNEVLTNRKQGDGQVVRLKKTHRLGVRHFKPKQNKKGVVYKISKKQKRQFVPGAFQGPRPGQLNTKWKGNAFKRTGKKRTPIFKILGPSLWGSFVVNHHVEPTTQFMRTKLRARLIHEANHLIRTSKQ